MHARSEGAHSLQIRLQKFLSEAGVASRRASEELIRQGKVSVNGHFVRELGVKVDPAVDRVLVAGKAVRPKRKIYLALNKPAGYICSKADPEGRPSVYELIPKGWRELNSVGRLDFNTEGLLLMTNDGEFTLTVTHPRYAVAKIYQATVRGSFSGDKLARLTSGIFDAGEKLRAQEARVVPEMTSGGKTVVELTLTEGKRREVRRMFEAQGMIVKKLMRIKIGPVELGGLPSGHWRELTEVERGGFSHGSSRGARSRKEDIL